MDTVIRERLLALNPWFRDPERFAVEVRRRLPDPFVPRRVDRTGLDDRRRAKLIVGPRRAGKSTFVWSLLADRPPETVLFLNCEEERVRAWARSPAGMVDDLDREFPQVRTLFLEEAQHLEEAGLVVKGLIDASRGLDVLVTGSSSYHLAARTRESLAGRAVRRRILPLSLGEVLDWRAPAVPAARAQLAREVTARQEVFGGYPGVWFHPDPAAELSELLEAFVLRDASDRFRIQRPEAFRRLIQLAAGQVGQMVNLSEWASLLGIATSTVREYLELLEETWVVRLIPAFAGGRRAEITHAARVHMVDMGLRNAALGAFQADPSRRPDCGALAEGWVFGELLKSLPVDWGIHYWRAKGGAEMDFVLARGERLVAVEVKAGRRASLSRSARSFVDAYGPEALILVGGADGHPEEERLGSTRVVRAELHEVAERVSEAVGSPDP